MNGQAHFRPGRGAAKHKKMTMERGWGEDPQGNLTSTGGAEP